MPAKEQSAHIADENYKLLKQAIEEEKKVLKYWDDIAITSFKTNIEKKDHFTEGEVMDIVCGVRFDQAPPELFTVELFYIYDEEKTYKILPMESTHSRGGVTSYKYSLELEGYGAQSLNVRIQPANEIIQDIRPELIKWKD